VSVQLTRGRVLTETPGRPVAGRVAIAPPAPARDRNAADRLALKHWPRRHRILVCSLTGGTGRTTIAALIAATLAGLPYAQHWPPVLLVNGAPRRFDPTWPPHTDDRPEPPATPDGSQLCLQTTPSGFHLLHLCDPGRGVSAAAVQAAGVAAVEHGYAPVIIDNPCGLPSESTWARTAASCSVVLVVRPDESSLRAAAEALVWMHDQHLVTKQQVTVVVNSGAGARTRHYLPAAAALAIRCHGLHQLPGDPHLGPGPIPPAARPVPDRLRLRLAQIGLDIWHTSQTTNPRHPAPNPAHPRQEHR
jgi:hypothetical protein